jgi:integrative and conjugative element protein (TIGR02256 family)
VDELVARTDGIIQYIGEWHSHPDGSRTQPSPDDRQVFTWLANLMGCDGLPAIMMIVGDPEVTFVVEKVECSKTVSTAVKQ